MYEEVLKQWCSENHYSDTNPQLRREILEAGSLRINTVYCSPRYTTSFNQLT